MTIESRPEYQAAVIQMEADGLRLLPPEHQTVAERARHYIKCLIAGTAIAPCMTEKPVEDETISKGE